MFKIGEIQKLRVVKKVDFGVYLSDRTDDERILLPGRQVPEGLGINDEIEVFVYRDSDDRPIATVNRPKLTLGEIGLLEVVSVTKIGAFLDWGLERDLFLPYAQQTRRLQAGDLVLVSLYTDKSERLAATMKVYRLLDRESPYHTGDMVTGTPYEINDRLGVFVAVDNRYSAIIPRNELFGEEIKLGHPISLRVTKVRDDGQLNLCIRQKAYLQMEPDMEKIIKLIEENGGVLPFGEKSDPETIKRYTGMSKNEFKRAVGHLYKEQKVQIENGKISAV